MDIIDILLAKALTPQGQVETYAKLSQQAVQRANEAINNISTITEETNTNNTTSQETLANANEALTKATTAQETYESITADFSDAIDDELLNLLLEMSSVDSSDAITKNLTLTYPDGTTSPINNITKYYKNIGNNTDGTMTQQAIKTYVESVKTALEQEIQSSGGSGESSGSTNLGPENSDLIVVVGDDGTIKPGDVAQEDIIRTQLLMGTYVARNAAGLEIDYANRSIKRVKTAENRTTTSDFDKFTMYGGRRRCIVSNSGSIIAFYGEAGYVEDGSAGQVMVYQPKFYYMRIPIETINNSYGTVINKEILLISPEKQSGYTIHPLFLDENGNELDYVLLSAYEGSAYHTATGSYYTDDEQTVDLEHDILSSIAGTRPISGLSQNFTVTAAEQMAENRGQGWQITDAAFESVNQLLLIMEYGSLNVQNVFNKGVTEIGTYNTLNAGVPTGSTSSLGNKSGQALSTPNTINGTQYNYTNEGRCAISYRGMENPYGNMWRFIKNMKGVGNGTQYGGVPYIDNIAMSQMLPRTTSWIGNFGYNSEYAWLFIPIESTITANSALPVGDYCYVTSNLNGETCCAAGGMCNSQESAGPFYYGCDHPYDHHSYSYSARLMHKPHYNSSIYRTNINKWKQEVGGE